MKHNKILYFTVVICCIVCISGCKKNDWLDAKPKKSVAIPSTIRDFQALLDQAELRMNYYSPTLGEIASDGHYVTDAIWANLFNNAAVNAYTWSKKYPYVSIDIPDWSLSYHKLFRANLVLEGLRKIKPSNAIELNELNDCKGQALYHRANILFSVAQLWAPQYDSLTAHTDLSIPLRLESDVTIPSTRSSVKQTYDQIISDLKEAVDLLPTNSLYLTRGSKISTHALLARIYLSVRCYDSALVYANKCLGAYSVLLDYNTISTNTSFIGGFTSTNPKNTEVLFYNSMNTAGINNILTANCLIDTTLYNKYDTNDLRKNLFFKINADKTIIFKGNYDNNSTKLFSGLATDEIFLIRAECLARKGQIVLAMNDLNTLLKMRWKKNNGVSTYIDQTAVNVNDAVNRILNERTKELLLRGIRWTDLRRLNKEGRQIMINRSIGGNNYVLEPNNFRYTFPIPDDVIQITGMQQNLGW